MFRWKDDAKDFIDKYGLSVGPLNGRRNGGTRVNFLRSSLVQFLGREIAEDDPVYKALLIVRKLPDCVGLNVGNNFAPVPSHILPKTEFINAFTQLTESQWCEEVVAHAVNHLSEGDWVASRLGVLVASMTNS